MQRLISIGCLPTMFIIPNYARFRTWRYTVYIDALLTLKVVSTHAWRFMLSNQLCGFVGCFPDTFFCLPCTARYGRSARPDRTAHSQEAFRPPTLGEGSSAPLDRQAHLLSDARGFVFSTAWQLFPWSGESTKKLRNGKVKDSKVETCLSPMS